MQAKRAQVVLLVLASCSAAPRGVEHAQKLLDEGDFVAAERAADQELARLPDNRTLWHIKIRAPMERGDSVRGVDGYMKWHRLRHSYDDAAMRHMAIAVLRRGLVDPAAEVRKAAVKAAARLRLPSLTERVAALIDDRDEGVAATATVAMLGRSGHARRRAESLLASADAGIRAVVVAGVGRKLGEREWLRAALDDESAAVRRAAVSGLGSLAADGDRLRLLARNDPDGTVRAAAMSALRSFSGAASWEVARQGLGDPYIGARLAALSVVASSSNGRALVAQMARSTDYYLALRAAVALRKAGGEAPAETVAGALAHRTWPVRVAALNALGEIVPASEAVALAEPLLGDPRLEVALAAARVSARLGRSAAAAQLYYRVLSGPREELRLIAATELVRMDDDRGARGLALLGKSRSPATRRAAALAHRFTDNVSLPLVEVLADADAGVRIAAAETMLSLL